MSDEKKKPDEGVVEVVAPVPADESGNNSPPPHPPMQPKPQL